MRTLRVTFSDACSDVLAWLADQPRDFWATSSHIADSVAPPDAEDARTTVSNAMSTLYGCGLIEGQVVDGDLPVWRATDEGVRTVADARAKESPPCP